MENSIEKPTRNKTPKVCCEKVEYNKRIKEFEADGNKKEIPQYGITIPEGEMLIDIEEYTGIRENGITLSRFSNTLEKTMISKKILANEAKEATKRFMKEKGLTSIKEIIEQSKEAEKSKQEKVPEMPEVTGEFKGIIAENGEIVRATADSER